MITREDIEGIALDCGVNVSHAEKGKGGFILDSPSIKYQSLSHIVKQKFDDEYPNENAENT